MTGYGSFTQCNNLSFLLTAIHDVIYHIRNSENETEMC